MVTLPRSAKALAEQVDLSETRLKPFRRARLMMMREYHGPYYGVRKAGDSETGPTPINCVAWYVNVMLPHLFYADVEADVTAVKIADLANPDEEFTAELASAAWNVQADEIDLARSLRIWIMDALIAGTSFIKTGIVASPADDQEGYLHDPGKPFADPISLDDYIIDPFARGRESAMFEGNKFRVPKSALLDSGLYDSKRIENLSSYAGPRGESRLAKESVGENLDLQRQTEEIVELVELWLPRERVVVTLPAETGATVGFLREEEYIGPERGPYEDLVFHRLPDNVFGVSPVGIVYDLHCMMNGQARKAGRRAARNKSLVLVDETVNEGEVNTVKDAGDGAIVGVQNKDRYAQVTFGGENEKLYENIGFLMQQFNRIARNPELLGGTAVAEKTLGQSEMLMQSAGSGVQDMRACVESAVNQVGRKLFWYLWVMPRTIPVQVQKGGVTVPVQFGPEMREQETGEYRFKVDLYSRPPGSPEAKYRRTMEWLNQTVIPLVPLAQAQGVAIDVGKLFMDTAKMHGIENAEDYVKQMPPPPPVMPGQEVPGQTSQPKQGQRQPAEVAAGV